MRRRSHSQIQLLNDIWLMTILAVLVGTGLPWLVSDFQVDIVSASCGLLALGVVHVVLTIFGAPLRQQTIWKARAITLLETVGVLLLGFIWEHVGALQNPLFLVVFVLPIIGSIFLSRWHPYFLAAVGILTVGFVSLGESSELRWFAGSLTGSDWWLRWLFGPGAAAPEAAFSAFSAPINYLLVLLQVFCIGLIACAVAAEYVGIIFSRLNEDAAVAHAEAQRGEALWLRLVEHLPLPALLIDPTSLDIVAISESARTFLDAKGAILEDRLAFEVLKFSYPEVIQELITGADGEVASTVLRIGEDLRLTLVKVLHVMHKERRLALLTIKDETEIFCVRSALDSSEYAALVIDPKGRVLAFNRPLVGLLTDVKVGMEAERLLPPTDPGLRWWEPGLTGRRKLHMQIGSRIYELTASAVALPGEDASIFSVSFLPIARGASADSSATNSTIITGTVRALR
jgi:PAS domain-containing protein